jgi:hypothetical protein
MDGRRFYDQNVGHGLACPIHVRSNVANPTWQIGDQTKMVVHRNQPSPVLAFIWAEFKVTAHFFFFPLKSVRFIGPGPHFWPSYFLGLGHFTFTVLYGPWPFKSPFSFNSESVTHIVLVPHVIYTFHTSQFQYSTRSTCQVSNSHYYRTDRSQFLMI